MVVDDSGLVPLSLAEVGCVSLAECTESVLFLGHLFEFLWPWYLLETRVAVSEDDDGVIELAASNPICTNRRRHMDVRHLFIRETVEQVGMKLLLFMGQ